MRGRDIVVIFYSLWLGEDLGLGLWFVLFRTYWSEEISYLFFCLRLRIQLKIGPTTFLAIAFLLSDIFSRHK